MNCRTVQNLTSAFLEEEVSAEERHAMDAHLPLCRDCTAALHDTRRMLALVHGLARLEPPADFVDGVMQQVRDAAEAETDTVRGWRRFLPLAAWPDIQWPRYAWAPVAMAAGVLLTLGGIRIGLVPVAGLQPQVKSVAVAPARPAVRTPAPLLTAVPRDAAASVAVHHLRRRVAAGSATMDVATRNPLGDSQVSGSETFELRGHDLLDPSYGTQVDLVLDRVSLDGSVILPMNTVQPVQEQRRPLRRLRTF